MKLHEKLQYKLRNYLYEQEQRKNHYTHNHTKQSKEYSKNKGEKQTFLDAISEIDEYIGEQLKGSKLPKFHKDE